MGSSDTRAARTRLAALQGHLAPASSPGALSASEGAAADFADFHPSNAFSDTTGGGRRRAGDNAPPGAARPADGADAEADAAMDRADFFNLDDMLPADVIALRRKVRAWARANVAPVADECYEKGVFPLHLWPKLHADLPEIGGGELKGYGCAGMSLVAWSMVCMEMTRVDTSFAAGLVVHVCLAMQSIALLGSAAQKETWLPAMARYEAVGSMGLTEPNHGSDVAGAMETIAHFDAARNGWVINGAKRWIGNSVTGQVCVLYCRNGDTGGIAGFIVPTDTPGFEVRKIEGKMALRAVENGDITMKDMFLPESQRMPHCIDFVNGPQKVLFASRVTVAWIALGQSLGVYDATLRYVMARKQFRVRLASFQLTQMQLFKMCANIQAMTLLVYRLTDMAARGKMSGGQAALAKAWCTERTRQNVSIARAQLGGNGILYQYGVARHFLDCEATHTFEGTYEILALVVGREITGIAALRAPSKRGARKKRVDAVENNPH